MLLSKISGKFIICASLLLGAVVELSGCTDNAEALRSLEINGFSSPMITDFGSLGFLHGCDIHDLAWYQAQAINSVGKPVNVIVCCGGPLAFKGCTIRTKQCYLY